MPEFVTLSCPSCGGKLDITPDIDRFACAHCGHEHIVKRGGGLISLAPVMDAIKNIGVGVDKTAAELALVRLAKELDLLQERKQQVILSMPRPKPQNNALIKLMGLVAVLLLVLLRDPSAFGAAPALPIAALCLLIGVAFLAHSKAVHQWEATFSDAIAPLDADISKKEEEKDEYLRIVQSQPLREG